MIDGTRQQKHKNCIYTMRRFQFDRSSPLKVLMMTLKPQLPNMYAKTLSAAKVWNSGFSIDCNQIYED